MRTIYFATDEDGETWLYSQKPIRKENRWEYDENKIVQSMLPDMPYILYKLLTGKTIERFSWENEPIAINILEEGDTVLPQPKNMKELQELQEQYHNQLFNPNRLR